MSHDGARLRGSRSQPCHSFPARPEHGGTSAPRTSSVRLDGEGRRAVRGRRGFRLGLEAAGWEVIWANQWEPSTKTQHAFDCYVSHFDTGVHVNEDINVVLDQIDAGERDSIPTTTSSSAASRARTTRSRRR